MLSVSRTKSIPIAAIVAGGVLAFFIWTLPSWNDFLLILSQFSDLWQISSNRLIMIGLVIRVLSPLFIMAIIGIVVLIWHIMPGVIPAMGMMERASGEAIEQDPVTPIPETLFPLITIRLLGEMGVWINVPDQEPFPMKLVSNMKKLQMLAYIAWRQGKAIEREKILEEVFGWGLSDEESTSDKLQVRFDDSKKMLKKDLKRAIDRINALAGKRILDPNIELFVRTDTGVWRLADICEVPDLAGVDAAYQIIAEARTQGKLAEGVPEEVKDACERLVDGYSGDFLAALITGTPDAFAPWRGRSSWVRKPLTLYRDRYLDALWLLAEYYEKQGRQDQKQEAIAKAAGFYKTYAMHVSTMPTSRWDLKVSWRGQSERVNMSEKAVSRAVTLFASLGQTDEVNRIWSGYSLEMRKMSEGRWKPGEATQQDVDAALNPHAQHFLRSVPEGTNR